MEGAPSLLPFNFLQPRFRSKSGNYPGPNLSNLWALEVCFSKFALYFLVFYDQAIALHPNTTTVSLSRTSILRRLRSALPLALFQESRYVIWTLSDAACTPAWSLILVYFCIFHIHPDHCVLRPTLHSRLVWLPVNPWALLRYNIACQYEFTWVTSYK